MKVYVPANFDEPIYAKCDRLNDPALGPRDGFVQFAQYPG